MSRLISCYLYLDLCYHTCFKSGAPVQFHVRSVLQLVQLPDDQCRQTCHPARDSGHSQYAPTRFPLRVYVSSCRHTLPPKLIRSSYTLGIWNLGHYISH
jgi:hypothetical protein